MEWQEPYRSVDAQPTRYMRPVDAFFRSWRKELVCRHLGVSFGFGNHSLQIKTHSFYTASPTYYLLQTSGYGCVAACCWGILDLGRYRHSSLFLLVLLTAATSTLEEHIPLAVPTKSVW